MVIAYKKDCEGRYMTKCVGVELVGHCAITVRISVGSVPCQECQYFAGFCGQEHINCKKEGGHAAI